MTINTNMPRHLLIRRIGSRQPARRGVATVELAICLPMLMLLVVGAIESSNMIFLQQAVTVAAYESVHVVSRGGGTIPQAQTRADQILGARAIGESTVSYSPTNADKAPRGEVIAVTVTAPVASNAIGLGWFFDGQTVSATVRMVKN